MKFSSGACDVRKSTTLKVLILGAVCVVIFGLIVVLLGADLGGMSSNNCFKVLKSDNGLLFVKTFSILPL